jgi:hypothetical protein
MAYNKCFVMLKVAILIFMGSVGVVTASGQMVSTMEDQVAALEAYEGTEATGYAIVEQGLDVYSSDKGDEFALHSDYFSSLRLVKPGVSQAMGWDSIVAMENSIITRASAALRKYTNSLCLGANEMAYFSRIFHIVINKGMTDVQHARDVLTDGKLMLADRDRMERVRQAGDDLREWKMLVEDIIGAVDVLVEQRLKEGRGADAIKGWYGLK